MALKQKHLPRVAADLGLSAEPVCGLGTNKHARGKANELGSV
jgi:hypothetical protein